LAATEKSSRASRGRRSLHDDGGGGGVAVVQLLVVQLLVAAVVVPWWPLQQLPVFSFQLLMPLMT